MILAFPYVFSLCAALVGLLPTAILTLSYFIGQRHKDWATDEPYEGGIIQAGSARPRFSAQFLSCCHAIRDLWCRGGVYFFAGSLGFYEDGDGPGYIGDGNFHFGQLVGG